MLKFVALAIVHRTAVRPLTAVLLTAYRKLPIWTTLPPNALSPLSSVFEFPSCAELGGLEMVWTLFTVGEPSVAPEPLVPFKGVKLSRPDVVLFLARIISGSVDNFGPKLTTGWSVKPYVFALRAPKLVSRANVGVAARRSAFGTE